METSFLIDKFECGKCPFESLYTRDIRDEAMCACPDCGNTGGYLKVEMGYTFKS